jgi:DNA-binding MarR family transcriptional regulator
MNRGTTRADVARAELACRATAALEAVASAADRELDRHAAEYGLSDAKLELLEVLGCCADRRACLYHVGERLGVTRPNVTKLVDGLERNGLVERLPHPSDKRMVQAHLTPAGQELAARALPGRRAHLARLWQGLDDDELATLADLLDRATERLATSGAGRGAGAPAPRPAGDQREPIST